MHYSFTRIFFLTVLVVGMICSMASGNADDAVSARGEGIGFAFSVLADEPFGSLYNPASIAYVKGWQFQLEYYRPTSYGLAVDGESPYGGLVGVNYYNENIGNFAISTHQFGSFTDPTSVTTSSIVNFAYGRQFENNLAVGVGVHYLFESNWDERTAFDIDLGATWRSNHNFSLAAVGENLLKSEMKSDLSALPQHLHRKMRLTGAYHIPMMNNLGSILAGWQFEQAGENVDNNTSMFNVGSEWWISTHNDISFGIRAGYSFGETSLYDTKVDYNRWGAGLSLNFDLNGKDLRIDYAMRSYPFESDESLSADHMFSFIYGWGGVPDYGTYEKSDNYDLSRYKKIAERVTNQPQIVAPATPDIKQPESMQQTEQFTDNEPLFEPPYSPSEPMHTDMPEAVTQTSTPAPVQEFIDLPLALGFTYMNVGASNKLIFYLRPDGIVSLTNWELYVFAAKLKHWDDTKVRDFSIHHMDGKGVPPLSVIWNGRFANGGTITPGKYYYIVTGTDKYGSQYKSEWCKFKVE